MNRKARNILLDLWLVLAALYLAVFALWLTRSL